ncbi:MAG: 30S ribosomal protein S5 [Candidatus Omnitrophica bacterium]|nr:30S ribosomal protein S5 [Candidatus Omnitrophota bacterium]
MQSVDKANDKKLAYSSDNAPAQGPGQGRDSRGRGQGGKRSFGPKQEAESSGLIESVIRISRVAKVTKGGTKLSFSALVVVGDGKGNVGYALGKAGEVAVGIKKGLNSAKKRMITVSRRGTTIPHAVIGKWCATEVLLKPASDGTGVIASGPVRAICDGAGIKNILTKVHRSSNPLNVVKATFEGLSRLKKVKVNEENAAVPGVQQTANKVE